MLLRKYITCLIVGLLISTGLQTVQAAILPPNQAQDSINKLLRYADRKGSDDLGEATKAINGAIQIAQESNLPKQLFIIYRKQGYMLEQNSLFPDATAAYRNALTLQNVVNDSSKIDIFTDWAIINKKLGNYKISKEYYTYALLIAEKQNDPQMMCYAYNGLATLHSALSDFEKAIEYYHQAIKILGNSGKKSDLVAPYRNIAIVYLKANNMSLALSNAEKSYRLALELQDSANIAGCLEILATVYAANGQTELALTKNLEALQIIENKGSKHDLLENLIQTANIYVQLNQLDKADAYYKRCFEYIDLLDYKTQPVFYNKLGSLYLKQGKTDEAQKAFEHSLALSTEGGFKDLIQKNNLSLAQIFRQKGNFKSAYRCLETARVYADSLFNEEKGRNITQAQFMFDVERSEQKFKDLQLKQSQYLLIAAVLFFSVITLFLIYFLNQRIKNYKVLKMNNSKIEMQNQRLEESNEILRQFAYASAHDLKEPLRSISSFTNIIKKRYVSLLPPEASDYMNFVTTGVKRMESLLSALLEYSTLIAENNIVSLPISIHSVLEDVTNNLHLISTEKEATISYAPMMGSLKISRLHLTQLFQNLIGNALKFTNKPPVISITCQANKEEFLITLKDNGIGMNPDYGDKVFRLFQRLNKSSQYEGTGIGLTICKNIVEKYSGKIWFESKEGEGTTFFISFPLELVQPAVSHTEGEVVAKKDFITASN